MPSRSIEAEKSCSYRSIDSGERSSMYYPGIDRWEKLTRLSDEKKIGVVVLWKNNDEYFGLTPEKRTELNEEWNEIFKRWKDKAKLVVSYHAAGMGALDGFEVWEVTDIGDWEAFNEEVLRLWNKYMEYDDFYVGINDP